MTRPDLADRRGVETVYGAAEDSILLADAAVDDVSPEERVLDVGTGSGYVAARVAETGAEVVGTDVNPHACLKARDEGVEVVRGNLADPFRDGAFDVVLFNPPYLPTPPEKEWDDWMEHALSGGDDGRRVIDPFLDTVGRVLAPDGEVLLLISTLTGVEEVRDRAGSNGFDATVVTEDSHPYETLLVVRLTRRDD
ncbi:HemK2/MTQ2 family protein methyltransferase [Haloarculaceae archaeon H-GB2-1]|nr:class I SAM-dependent methyltransferase [Haloarculaceae archaeon H-GB1-1]MEA5408943.1 HemK2/MTQ2 family protein methyltransferase [Haloarculaceae archaeon H-GB2-1]